ncbi:hypothetical protein [Chelatococcus composti]|uniref:Uncharacterized protein n=1 Tax=Chelatococcus composti TaxID=1743235 RepID=A0A841KJA5_9HYPH|nr:hypothetical protein [Chelatococcus composti]MBB6169473.1 hypothetical protein [Chelatococcus composti]MBS7737036.1 hypothetical protein [Chelatococcus composti]
MCRCAERRAALGRSAHALVRGDGGRALDELRFVARSAAQDASQALAQKVAAARARLRR